MRTTTRPPRSPPARDGSRPASSASPMTWRRMSCAVASAAVIVRPILPPRPVAFRRLNFVGATGVGENGFSLGAHGVTGCAGEELAAPRASAHCSLGQVARERRVAGERDREHLRARDERLDAQRVLERGADVGAAVDDERRHVRQRPGGDVAAGRRSASRGTARPSRVVSAVALSNGLKAPSPAARAAALICCARPLTAERAVPREVALLAERRGEDRVGEVAGPALRS